MKVPWLYIALASFLLLLGVTVFVTISGPPPGVQTHHCVYEALTLLLFAMWAFKKG